eukprot:XP_020397990.1 uncharacterized protein DKFZp434B061-like [Zea mays]
MGKVVAYGQPRGLPRVRPASRAAQLPLRACPRAQPPPRGPPSAHSSFPQTLAPQRASYSSRSRVQPPGAPARQGHAQGKSSSPDSNRPSSLAHVAPKQELALPLPRPSRPAPLEPPTTAPRPAPATRAAHHHAGSRAALLLVVPRCILVAALAGQACPCSPIPALLLSAQRGSPGRVLASLAELCCRCSLFIFSPCKPERATALADDSPSTGEHPSGHASSRSSLLPATQTAWSTGAPTRACYSCPAGHLSKRREQRREENNRSCEVLRKMEPSVSLVCKTFCGHVLYSPLRGPGATAILPFSCLAVD